MQRGLLRASRIIIHPPTLQAARPSSVFYLNTPRPVVPAAFWQQRGKHGRRIRRRGLFTERSIQNIDKRTVTTMWSSTIKLPISGLPETPHVRVSLPADFTKEQLDSFSPFRKWLDTLTHSLSLQHKNPQHPFHADPYALQSIEIQSVDMWGARVGFLKLKADIRNGAGEHLGGSVFLRGPAVAMLVMLIPDDAPTTTTAGEEAEEERYVVLTKQPRVPAGSLDFTELPAGMVDDADDDGEEEETASSSKVFAGAAAREIKEELDMEIPASELVSLTDLAAEKTSKGQDDDGDNQETVPFAMFPSAGGCDEYIPILMHERRVPRKTLEEWQGRLTGLRRDGEKITLKIVPMRDLWREGLRDAKALAAVALWEGLKREGKLPKSKLGRL
ncbi:hypothetical protein F5Y17DRAFT_320423 [Xylariaceae sp. FL0594]|nr:hypothetical protein F5Y17DRAFT_320423 [Xylariaceae sp. FL0594]